MSLSEIGKETVEVVKRGEYLTPAGRTVSIGAEVSRAVAGTVLYRPQDLEQLVASRTTGSGAPQISVTAESTADAAKRLVQDEGTDHVVALNFASARHPGGGFLGEAKAQEEDLARRSALYECLLSQPAYYGANRAESSLLYTDHIIYSPDVPFFRDRRFEFLERHFLVSLITAPAPNAGAMLPREPKAGPRIRATLESRAAKVLAVAAEKKHRCLVLGAWGCGAFRNDPRVMADIFARHLAAPAFAGAFDRVIFAIYARGPKDTALSAFQERFPSKEGCQ
jgi:uncharacterized protein (TIGR02452 family)